MACVECACKTNNKLIETNFRKATRDADIILISETWGKPSQNIQLDGYEVILCHKVNTDPREKRGSGGIAALIKTKVFPKINVYKSFKDIYVAPSKVHQPHTLHKLHVCPPRLSSE